MTKYNQYENINDSSMVFALGFRMQVYTQVTMRDGDFKTKN